MKCPYCGYQEDKVIDSRGIAEGTAVRRRRECLKCESRFTSYERVEEQSLMVVKKDGRREPYSREKILSGILKAIEKRPISMDAIDALVKETESQIHSDGQKEILSSEIGQLIMERLHKIDQVAYVRFASVYRQFEDISDFVKEIIELS
jgi:transcriptional repressor NrdR